MVQEHHGAIIRHYSVFNYNQLPRSFCLEQSRKKLIWVGLAFEQKPQNRF